MNLIVQYYTDKHAVRQKEIDDCLWKNVENGYIKHIHLLLENDVNLPTESEKIYKTIIGKRLSYKDAFSFAGENLANQICILSNADIFFNDTISLVTEELLTNKIYALSRYDLSGQGKLNIFNRKDSQDVWIFKPPLPSIKSDFLLGMPGCDNRIAYEIKAAGIEITNPCLSIKVAHVHKSKKRNYKHSDQLKGPIMKIDHTQKL